MSLLDLYASYEELESVAEAIEKLLPPHAVVILRGDLAAGKTTLVNALALRLGVEDAVTSPTFSIQQIYGDRLYHYDLYQCPNEKFVAMGLLDALDEPGWHLLEWGDDRLIEILKEVGFEPFLIQIEPAGEKRRYRMDHA